MKGYVYRAILHPAEEGGFWVDVPALPGCVTDGDTYEEAVMMAADALKTYVAALLLDGDPVPPYQASERPDGCLAVEVYFETDESYIVTGDVVSAAEASRRLGVSAGRVTRMIDSGVLEGYRQGRRTFVTVESVERRIREGARPGRPRSRASA